MVARSPRLASTWSISRAISCIATSLEGERRSVKQFQHEGVRAALHQGCYRRVAEARIGLIDHRAKVVRLDLAGGERLDHAEGDFLVALSAHRPDVLARKAGPLARHIQAAVAGQSRQKRIAELECGRFAPVSKYSPQTCSPVVDADRARCDNAGRFSAARLI